MSTLLIHSCEGVVWSRRKAPNLYVVCQQEGQAAQRTVVVKRDRAPKWEHIYHLSSDSAVTLRLWHDSLLKCRDVCLGTVRTEVATLRDTTNSEGNFIKLQLTGAGQQSNGKSTGTLLVRLMTRNEGATMAVDQAQHSIQPMISSSSSALLDTAGKAENSEPVTQTLEAGLSILIAKLHLVVCIGNEIAKIHPYANIAWTVLTSVYQVIKKQQDTDDQLQELVNTMVSVYAFVEETESLAEKIKTLEDRVLVIVQQTVQCALFIREYMGNGFTTRAIRSLWDNTQKTITNLSNNLVVLKDNLETGLTVQGISLAIEKLDGLVQSDALKMLDPMKMNATLRPICLKGTRVQLLKDITEWLMDPGESGRFLWLTGVAGCGKSTISTTISDTFRGLHRLGAFLFFDRNDPSHSQPGRVIATLAHSLAHLDSHIGNTISAALRDDPNIVNAPIGTQFKTLLLDPLLSAQQHIHGPILIVLDALDECGDPHSRRSLLSVITTEFVKLPPVFRLLITSRREADLSDSLGNHFIERSVAPSASARDVELFIQNELEVIRQKSKLRLSTWPSPIQLQTLTDLAGGLFIWAATAVKFIDGYKPNDRMESLINDNVKTLDKLYTLTLRDSASWDDPKFARDARAVLACIVFGQVPMTNTTIDALLGADHDSAEVLKSLGCVVHWCPGCVCRVLHASFADYLTDTARSKGLPWAITTEFGHHSLASGCLRILNSDLRFNICDLEDSHILNVDVPDISNRVATNISPQLAYSSRFWGVHLAGLNFDQLMLENIKNFFELKFLFWLEVMSLLAQVPIVSGVLDITAHYVKGCNDNLENLIIDTTKFISAFSPLIARSAPHIYISAVPFAPQESKTAKQFIGGLPRTVHCDGPLSVKWPAIQKIFRWETPCDCCDMSHHYVSSVEFSPDGARIASGSGDKTIHIWDIHTGLLACAPLKHSGFVDCISFSPQGTQITSGTADKTVHVWDTQTGTLLAGPLTGHTDHVLSVHFSPDGRSIVSESRDKTVRVWDAQTGQPVGCPFIGHTDTVYSVKFSPDGTQIISGSGDETVRVWDTKTGALVIGSFTEYGPVFSVHFSLDGTRIASGCGHTVCVWDTHTGTLIAGPSAGHTDNVESVYFSPDSTRIVSGSSDKSICVWDTQTGALVAGPFTGHALDVTSVCFSLDGQQILSGSFDGTVCLWDAHGTVIVPTSPGHTGEVRSICFSPDGTRIASGSSDSTVCVWDTESGALVAGPLNCHEPILSIDFAPDGMRIAAGTEDGRIGTVQVWDVQSGILAAGPFRHGNGVSSVQFLPDGTRIASVDLGVCISDAESGARVAGTFGSRTSNEGHDYILCVNVSQNGRWITSGAWDNMVCVWDAETAALIAGPFTGHTDWVKSVHFSPDSRQIASGSLDSTVRIWDAQTGTQVAEPFTGHTDGVRSVQFSPSGKQIVSGSADNTVCVWATHTGTLAAGPFTGHTAEVSAVCFSPDGKKIASGSSDRTIHVYKTGQLGPNDIHAPMEVNTQKELFMFDSKSGWVRDTGGALILWVPPWLRAGFYLPHDILIISKKGATKVNYSRFVHGTEWAKCFDPEFTSTK